MAKKYKLIQSLERAFAILEQFSQDEPRLGVTTIADRVGLHKSTCFGLLYTLQQLGYVQQDPESGLYSLGLKTFALGQAYIEGQDLRQLAGPYLRELVKKTQETAHLVVLEGHRAVYIDKVEGSHAITISSRIGRDAQLHCSGVGKVLLANMEEQDRNLALEENLEAFTKKTITDKDKLREQLTSIRECGYSIDDEEVEIGLRCVAAPIFNAQNQAFAAISLSGPSGRIHEDKFEEISRLVRETASQISRRLGSSAV